ncbi:MAG: hypothetical protein LBH04_06475 [Tannerellaceae bacterium]|jgi:hypothetical protein|nr:hypothetical protein [Tannerellaceae bacterium]
MKKYCILFIICVSVPPIASAQQSTEYNRKGDEALRKKDYNDARLYYSEGIANCDMYSINKLTAIWKDNVNLRNSLHSLMNRCLGCLNNGAAQKDSDAIALLSEYYMEGIGTQRSPEMSAHWANELKNFNNTEEEEQVETYTGSKREVPRTRIFAGYTFSLYTPIGITFGAFGPKKGWYGRIKTNAVFRKYDGEMTLATNENGRELPPASLEDYLKREQSMSTLALSGGMMFHIDDLLSFSLGLGYFKTDRIFAYTRLDDAGNIIGDKQYFKVKNYSYQGAIAEVDGIWAIGKLYVAAGIGSHISSRLYLDFNISAGIFF